MIPSDHRVLAALSKAADEGQRCPSNIELAAVAGVSNDNLMAGAMKRIEQAGHITVYRRSNVREVTIVATGKVTASVGRRPSHPVAACPPVPMAPRPARDACPLCNVRPEFGCRHGWNGEYFERVAA
jgi:hypothetical protein